MEGIGRSDFVGCSSSEVSEVSAAVSIEDEVPVSNEVGSVMIVSRVDADDVLSLGGDGVNVLRNGDDGEFCFCVS